MPKNPTDVEDVWTAEDEAIYRPLRRKILRIEARRRKDKAGRLKRYGARRRKSDDIMLKDSQAQAMKNECEAQCRRCANGTCSLEEKAPPDA